MWKLDCNLPINDISNRIIYAVRNELMVIEIKFFSYLGIESRTSGAR